MASKAEVLRKLEGTPLRDFYEDKKPGRVSVLIQPHLVAPRFSTTRDQTMKYRWTTVEGDAPAGEDTVEAARELIERITHKDPAYIKAANAFVSEVSREELREIASSDAVATVSLNRQLK